MDSDAHQSGRILVVDDERTLALVLARGLQYAGYETSVAHSGAEALDHLAESRFDLLLSDINMPHMRGDELQQIARERDADLAVVLMTAAHDTRNAIACLNDGVFDYLLKPFELADVEVRIANALVRRRQCIESRAQQQALLRRCEDQGERLAETVRGATAALTAALAAKDRNTFAHSCRVEHLAGLLATRSRPGDDVFVASVRTAALLHDIGKIGIPDSLLLKVGPLTDTEATEMQRHVEIGESILRPLLTPEQMAMVRSHHERIDGRGYPGGLSGDAVPLGGRILAVADAYDAMSSSRPYHGMLPASAVLEHLESGAGSHWDEQIVGLLRQLISEGAVPHEELDAPETLEGTTLAAG